MTGELPASHTDRANNRNYARFFIDASSVLSIRVCQPRPVDLK